MVHLLIELVTYLIDLIIFCVSIFAWALIPMMIMGLILGIIEGNYKDFKRRLNG